MLARFSSKPRMAQGIALAVTVYIALAIGDATLKRVTMEHGLIYTGFAVNLATIVCLLATAIFRKNIKALYMTQNLKLHLIRATIFLGVYLCFIYSIHHLQIATAYTFMLTQPFILAILAHLVMKEYIGIHRITAIIGGFCGVLIALRPGFVELEPAVLTAFGVALLFACQNILTKCMDSRDDWMSFVFYVMLVQTPLMALYLYVTGEFAKEPLPSPETLGWISLSGAAYLFGLGMMPLALRKIDAAVFGGLEFSILIWGTILGFLMFAEVPDIWTIAGAIVIVCSGVYLVYRERQAHFKLDVTKIQEL